MQHTFWLVADYQHTALVYSFHLRPQLFAINHTAMMTSNLSGVFVS